MTVFTNRLTGLSASCLTALGVLAFPATSAMACGTCGCQAPKAETSEVAADASAKATGNVLETAVAAGEFKTLVAAVKAAGLTDALAGDGPFTILAPSDKAFAKLPQGTLESLLKPENKEQLKAILLYHVIPADAKSDTVASLDKAKTLLGKHITIEADGDHLHLNEQAHVVKADIAATNGVIHVIDSVLLPPAEDEATASAAH